MNSHLLQVQELCQHSHPGAACPQLSHLAVAGGDPQALLFTATNSTGPNFFFFSSENITDSSTHPDRSAQAAEDAFHPYRTDCLRQKKTKNLQTPVGELQHLVTSTDTQSKAFFGFQPDTPHKSATNPSELAGSRWVPQQTPPHHGSPAPSTENTRTYCVFLYQNKNPQPVEPLKTRPSSFFPLFKPLFPPTRAQRSPAAPPHPPARLLHGTRPASRAPRSLLARARPPSSRRPPWRPPTEGAQATPPLWRLRAPWRPLAAEALEPLPPYPPPHSPAAAPRPRKIWGNCYCCGTVLKAT